jgi:hypothetical protein
MPLHLGVGASLPDVEEGFGMGGPGGGHMAVVRLKGYQGFLARRSAICQYYSVTNVSGR